MKEFNIKEFSYEQFIAAYDVLNVELCADFDTVVKKAYYKLSMIYHPDKNTDENATEKFKEIKSAYAYLQYYKSDIPEHTPTILRAAKKRKPSEPPQPSPKHESKSQAKPKPEPKAQAQQPQPQPEPKAQPKPPQPQPEPKAQPKPPQPQPEPKAQPKPQPQPEPKAQPKPPQPQPEPKAQPKPQPEPDTYRKSQQFNINEFSYEQIIAAYKVLNVELCADCDTVVKKAYYKLAMAYHPDKNTDKSAVEIFKEINSAYEYLQNYKLAILEHKTTILSASKKTKRSEPSQNSSKNEPNTYEKPQKAEDPLEALRRREKEALDKAKYEVESLKFAFEQISIPDYLNIFQSQAYLIKKCSTFILSEAYDLKDHVDDMISKLRERKSKIQLELVKLSNYTSYLFPQNYKKDKEEILSHFLNEIDHDLMALKLMKFDLGHTFASLKKDKCFSLTMELNSYVEFINTEIANIQLRNYYLSKIDSEESLVCALPRDLNLKNITRITEEFVSNHYNVSSHFTSLSQNNLYKIGKNIAHWKNLNKIKITNSPNIGFPSFLVKMANLKEIHLEGNHITALPENFLELHQLEILNLNNNDLYNLPKGFANLKNLTGLILSNNLFSHIPDEILKLTQLKELDFSNTTSSQSYTNKIREIPENLKMLINLEKLSLSSNQIGTIPESVIETLKKLAVLHIANNLLTTLPKNIGDLESLKFIDAQNNQITFIPSSFLKLKGKLRFCLLEKNHLHHHSASVAAVLYLMGETSDSLLSNQTFTESYPMALDDGFSFDDDEVLVNLSSEFVNFINSSNEDRSAKSAFSHGWVPLKTEF